jgi:hypothetical protein
VKERKLNRWKTAVKASLFRITTSCSLLKRLREDRRLVILAAAEAQCAADYVLGKIVET